jgi:hypothetical protein
MTALVVGASSYSKACLAGPRDFPIDLWSRDASISPRSSHSTDGSSRQIGSSFSTPPPPPEDSTVGATGPDKAPAIANSVERNEYDNDPVPLEELLREKDQHDDSKDDAASFHECAMWTKKDLVVPSSGLYRPWFFSRFAKGWIGISRAHALSDIRSILGGSCSSIGSTKPRKDLGGREREHREGSRDKERPRRSCKREESSGETADSADEDPETWVGCDECGKWRKIGNGIEVDTESAFFCSMIPGVTCSTPEEAWSEPVSCVDVQRRALRRFNSSLTVLHVRALYFKLKIVDPPYSIPAWSLPEHAPQHGANPFAYPSSSHNFPCYLVNLVVHTPAASECKGEGL